MTKHDLLEEFGFIKIIFNDRYVHYGEDVEELMQKVRDQEFWTDVIIDVGRVHVIDSRGTSILLAVINKARQAKKKVFVKNLNGELRKFFADSGLLLHFKEMNVVDEN